LAGADQARSASPSWTPVGRGSPTTARPAHIVGGEELGAQASTRTIRRRKTGETVITDGPFIETKESLGGFVILEAGSMDEALAIAVSWPGFPDWAAAVEVRQTEPTPA
jgi:hypothetical protein